MIGQSFSSQTLTTRVAPSPLPPLLSHKLSAGPNILPDSSCLRHRDPVPPESCAITVEKPGLRSSEQDAHRELEPAESGLDSLPCYAQCATQRRSALYFLHSRSSPHMTEQLSGANTRRGAVRRGAARRAFCSLSLRTCRVPFCSTLEELPASGSL